MIVSVAKLSRFAHVRFKPDQRWALGDEIAVDGWDRSEVIDLILRPGRPPRLGDGNRRVAYLALKGAYYVEVPIRIIFRE